MSSPLDPLSSTATTSIPSTSLPSYVTSLADNPYFGAGAGLFGLGALAVVARRSAQLLDLVVRRHMLMSLEVASNDKSYLWLLQCLTAHTRRATQHLSVETNFSQGESGRVSIAFDLVPSPGDHYVWLNQRFIKVERNRESSAVNMSTGVPFETLRLTTYGRDKRYFSDLLEQARLMATKSLEGHTVMYNAVGPEWRPFGYPRRKRPLNSVVLQEGLGESLHADLNEFIGSSQWYVDRGIPYRRGYLLHGPPGCGKSSFIMALCGALDYGIAVLSLSDRALTDDRLAHLLSVAPLQSIILLEDVDAAFVSRDSAEHSSTAYEGLSRLTFSGLLNTLDGVASSEGRLDPALIRPGRVDVKQYVGHCTDGQIASLFSRFYPCSSAQQRHDFVHSLRRVSPSPIPAAQVQGYLLQFKDDAASAIAALGDFHGGPKAGA